MSFKSFLKHIGENFKKGLDFVLPWAEGAGKVAVQLFAPELGVLFNTTVTAVALAEQKFAQLGKQSGTGTQKLADVLQIAGPLIKQGLIDVGKEGTDAQVQEYINAVVAILNAAPAPQSAA